MELASSEKCGNPGCLMDAKELYWKLSDLWTFGPFEWNVSKGTRDSIQWQSDKLFLKQFSHGLPLEPEN